MHASLTFFLESLRFLEATRQASSSLKVASLSAIMRLADVQGIQAQQLDTLMHPIIFQSSVGQPTDCVIDPQAIALLTHPQLNRQAARLSSVLQDMLLIYGVLEGDLLGYMRLEPADRLLFDALYRLSVNHPSSQYQQVIVGTLRHRSAEEVIHINQPGPLADITITYTADRSPLPLLSLSVGSLSNIESLAPTRRLFQHQVGAIHDLRLRRRQGEYLGVIKTRVYTPPWVATAGSVEIAGAIRLGLVLIRTEVFDRQNNCVLRSDRIADSSLLQG